MQYKSKAKINLFLHVVGVGSKSHFLESLVYFPNTFDDLSFVEDNEDTLSVSGDFAHLVPNNQNNLIFKALDTLRAKFNFKQNFAMQLVKNIPVGGGLGGGSSNAAVTMLALNDILSLNLSLVQLQEIGQMLGYDVPICLHQSPLFVDSDEYTPAVLPNLHMLLVNPKESVFTKEVFTLYKNMNHAYTPKLQSKKLNFANYNDLIAYLQSTHNDLTSASITLNNNIKVILDALHRTNPAIARMSGSGSTCFAIYDSANDLSDSYNLLKKQFPTYWIQRNLI